ncbi:uncharacterized protein [Physcomitrium patens]|uniref:Rab-GAP TBC domain-containing protein n=1 Tax=Physcomitrium patens TaxID=3218 RepID=A0A2K1JVJ8_PHYPA|nr:EVI5-like protein [Physcomitrium patens]PNR45550.1 hypothetical protein PHYPA_015321 [Physcomitrium patens]|eukprot:XP_024389545.1 EVI5-like protein [Physcomitrella patens]
MASPRNDVATFKEIRDIYGFAVRQQHLERYREYASIYKKEEVERSDRWEQFLCSLKKEEVENGEAEPSEGCVVNGLCRGAVGIDGNLDGNLRRFGSHRSSLAALEQELKNLRKRKASRLNTDGSIALDSEGNESGVNGNGKIVGAGGGPRVEEDEDSDDEFYDVERTEVVSDAGDQSTSDVLEPAPWVEELKVLVSGGVPVALRGELWQVFTGAKDRHVNGYYQELLAREVDHVSSCDGSVENNLVTEKPRAVEKWTAQIEKDLPRTFPGHPALDKEGLNALRRMLTAYARHNPSVGYCQAMNFVAALLLLLMPEENAFWTLTAIIDDYFEGYYSERMVEAQVDLLVFEQLVRERFPRLATHLESLGVQVAWVSGPWFLSIFVNVVPWETVLRVWDVLLYEGNRSMLFRTGLALIEIHAGALLQQRDTGDAVATLQSMGETTFDSSELVLLACLGFQEFNEKLLQELRTKHRPVVLAALDERSMELNLWRSANGIGSKLDKLRTSFDRAIIANSPGGTKAYLDLEDGNDTDNDGTDLQEQVTWLKTELCRALELAKASAQRADQLETALMEMVKGDNRRLLSAQVESLEAEVDQLKKGLAEKQEQEAAMVQVLLRMEQEQHVAEDARRFAEQEAETHRRTAEEAEKTAAEAVAALSAMEKRAIMAESMLEATVNFQTGGPQNFRRNSDDSASRGMYRSHSSPASKDSDSVWERRNSTGKMEGAEDTPNNTASKPGLFGRPFSLSWRDKSKLSVEVKANESDRMLDRVPFSAPSSLGTEHIHTKPNDS